jgi:hypothetical protein
MRLLWCAQSYSNPLEERRSVWYSSFNTKTIACRNWEIFCGHAGPD